MPASPRIGGPSDARGSAASMRPRRQIVTGRSGVGPRVGQAGVGTGVGKSCVGQSGRAG